MDFLRRIIFISEAFHFFRPDTKLHRKRSKAAVKAHERKRKPSKLNAAIPSTK
jgi:hypothetical protein